MAKKHRKDPESWKFKRGRNGDEHIGNCSDGYTAATSNKFRQVHHTVCVSSCSDANILDFVTKDKLKLLRNCMAVTDWNINASPNVISLPLKRAYVDARAPAGWDMLPCHLVDHNGDDDCYTEAVTKWLGKNVWNKVQKVAKKCEFDPEDLKSKMEGASKRWLRFLKVRGAKHSGTQHCWTNQMKLASTWYVPFSMGIKPKKRQPVDPNGLKGSVKSKLAQLFQLH